MHCEGLDRNVVQRVEEVDRNHLSRIVRPFPIAHHPFRR